MNLSDRIDQHKEDMLKDLAKLVSYRSLETPGEEGTPFGVEIQKCLQEALSMGEKMGFRTTNMDNMVGWCEYGEGEEMVAILGHLDVVPEADGWLTDPYQLTIKEGRAYGRGTIDDKGPVIASLYALRAIADAGILLKRRVRILFGTNEETGAADMKYYLAHGGEVPVMGFTPDGEYPLINGEKGIINETYEFHMEQTGAFRISSINGGVAGNVTPDYACAHITCPKPYSFPGAENISVTGEENGYLVEAFGISAHGSKPETGENAIGRLAAYLNKLPFTKDAKKLLQFLGETIGMECFAQGFDCDLYDEISGHTTFNMGVIKGDDQVVSVKLNYRYPVTFTYEDCQPKIEAAFIRAGFVQTAHLHKPKLYVPEEEKLIQSLLKVYREATGDMTGPKSIGGGTYAKAIPNIVAFGPLYPDDPIVEHCPNEYIEIERLLSNSKIIAHAIVELAGKE